MACKIKKPQVIDHNLIKTCLEEHSLRGEAEKLTTVEGIAWDDVLEIKLEFKYILRMDHLWVMPALSKLSLNNNFIEVIENLEALVHLKELNLSFNKISTLQNLDTLINLEVLLIHDNLISCIENVDKLTELTIFNIGMNHISDREQILKLRHHKKLRCLNMKGNLCAETEDFLIYIAAFLPQLQFYAYKSIKEDDRTLGLERYREMYLCITEADMIEGAAQIKLERDQAEAELHGESFVEFFNTNHLFLQMFEQDFEGKIFLLIGDEVLDCYNEFQEKLLEVTMNMFEIGQEQYKLRRKEVESYLKSVNDAKYAIQQESIEEIASFTKRKNEMVEKIYKMQEDLLNSEIRVEDYILKIYDFELEMHNIIIPKVWKKLMGLEMTLFEQMEDVNVTFENTLKEMIGYFIEIARGGFQQIRSLENRYLEDISDISSTFMAKSTSQDSFFLHTKLVEYITDKETLTNALSASHDTHLQIIDRREDRLINRAGAWLSNLVENLEKDEITRDRAKILEINHFLDINLETFKQICDIDRLYKRKQTLAEASNQSNYSWTSLNINQIFVNEF